MNEDITAVTDTDADILDTDVSDEALEAAAGAAKHPALSFVGAPTVSILVACCNVD